jgi:hypothetical protein
MHVFQQAGLALPRAVPRHLFEVQVARSSVPSTLLLCGTGQGSKVLLGAPLLQSLEKKHTFTSLKDTAPFI